MIQSSTPASDTSVGGLRDLTDRELDAVTGGEYSSLFRAAALGMVAAGQAAAGIPWAYVNTNCFLCP